MKTQILAILVTMVIGLTACGGNKTNSDKPQPSTPVAAENDGKGVGETKHVELNETLDQDMIDQGFSIYNMKCAACHKLSAQRVVGPGFKGVTDRRKPEWIMNMITNVEVMLDEDPEAQKLLAECLTRMPNQNLTIDDARNVLEFLLDNDTK